MPFTLAHPAAVIPLHRLLGRSGVLSALVIGSMSPDLVNFVPLGIERSASHCLQGLLWFCVPVGLAVYVLFHTLLRDLGYYLLPLAVQSRLPPHAGASRPPIVPLWAILASLLVGAVTHLLWDAFTHADGFVVEMIPTLQISLWEIGGYRVSVYKILQHGSTLIGLLLLGRWGLRWFRATRAHHEPCGWQPSAAWRRPVLLALLVVPALGGIISGVWHMSDAATMRALQQFARHGVITAMNLFAMLLLALGVIWRLWEASAYHPDAVHSYDETD